MHNHEGIELYREGNFGRNQGAEWNEIGGSNRNSRRASLGSLRILANGSLSPGSSLVVVTGALIMTHHCCA